MLSDTPHNEAADGDYAYKKAIHISLTKFQHARLSSTYVKKSIDALVGNTKPSDTTLLLSSYLERSLRQLFPVFDYIKTLGFKDVRIVIDTAQHPKDISMYNDLFSQVYVVNLYAIAMLLVENHYTPSGTAGLILTGNIARQNRIDLLKKLYDRKMLQQNKIIWTFSDVANQLDRLADYNPNLDPEFIEFCVTHGFTDDKSTYYKFPTTANTVYADFLNISKLYQKTGFSIIAETFYDSTNIARSEKTLRTILNNHPFILASSAGSLQDLKDSGFICFEKYLPEPDYDSISDPEYRLDAIANNIFAMPALLKKYPKYFALGAQHNTDRMMQIIYSDTAKIKDIYRSLGLDTHNILDRFELNFLTNMKNAEYSTAYIQEIAESVVDDQNETWMANYNNIKGDLWPELSNRTEFAAVPSWVKDEYFSFGLAP